MSMEDIKKAKVEQTKERGDMKFGMEKDVEEGESKENAKKREGGVW